MNDVRVNRAYANLRAAGMSETAVYRTMREILPKDKSLTYSEMRRVWDYYGVKRAGSGILNRKDHYLADDGSLQKGTTTYPQARKAGLSLGSKKEVDERFVLGHLMRQGYPIDEMRPEFQERFPSVILPNGQFAHTGY